MASTMPVEDDDPDKGGGMPPVQSAQFGIAQTGRLSNGIECLRLVFATQAEFLAGRTFGGDAMSFGRVGTWTIASAAIAVLIVVVLTLGGPSVVLAQQSNACASDGAVPDPGNNPGLVSDCAALLAARDTLAGTATLNWAASTPITGWEGVYLRGTPQRVTQVALNSWGLTGEIPAQLGNLSGLVDLNLSENELTGEIPTELGDLSSLRYLDLDHNRLTGEIPAELGELTSLFVLSLRWNQLTGEIPTELGDLPKLQHLDLDHNQLTGEIPTELSNISRLSGLSLGGNQLTGEIPAALGTMHFLSSLDLSFNELTGEIPTELGDLSDLYDLNLDVNRLTGEIPKELGNLSNLSWLHLSFNEFTGEMPTELGNLSSLEELGLSGNELTSEMPTELGNLANLRVLELGLNQLSGEIPTELGSLSNLQRLDLRGNDFSGEIPTELGSLSQLRRLQLNGNGLTGEIPGELGNLGVLQYLDLSDNELTGEIPEELGDLPNLAALYLSENQLTGCIPAGLRDVPDNDFDDVSLPFCGDEPPVTSNPDRAVLVALYNATDGDNWGRNSRWLSEYPIGQWRGVTTDGTGRVTVLGLHTNGLKGELPTELGSLTNLQSLSLWGNELTGTIPSELGDLSNLQSLWLRDNQLTGAIPSELGDLSKLEYLWLHENQLTGEIPVELGNLSNLQWLYLNDNQLTGQIPSELGNLTGLTHLYLANNQFTGCIPNELLPFRALFNTDLDMLALDTCASPPGAPTIDAVTTGTGTSVGSLFVEWSAPSSDGGLDIHAYDLRYIETSSDETADTSWTVVENAWITGRGNLAANIRGLADGTQYDIQVRAVSLAGDGSWSATATGTTAAPRTCTTGRAIFVDRIRRPTLVPDCEALLAARDTLAGTAELNWSADIPMEAWEGVTAEDTSAEGGTLLGHWRVIRLGLGSRSSTGKLSLNGTIPPELGNLSSLKELRLGINLLSGEIPPELGKLSSLRLLSLWANQLTGEIPEELGNLTGLTDLFLHENQLSGEVPKQLGNLAGLTHLYLDKNQLTGHIPIELGNLANLLSFGLGSNQLTGQIPAQLGNLANLQRLVLRRNQLTGEIPTELGNLNNLEYLTLQGNQLTGGIPSELGNLTNLRYLYLVGSNRFSECVPEEVYQLLPSLIGTDIGILPSCSGESVVVSAGEEPQVYDDKVFVLPVAEDLSTGSELQPYQYTARFLQYFEDEFDFLILIPHVQYNARNYSGRYHSVKNDVEGIGQGSFSLSERYGSADRLQGLVELTGIGQIDSPLMLHELMHRWANYAIPTSYPSHWGFSSANGLIGGFDIEDLVDHGEGRYSAGRFTTAGTTALDYYSPIELYMTGLIPPGEVPDLWVAEDGAWLFSEDGRCVRADNGNCMFTASLVRTYTIEDIIAEHGERIPDHSQSQRDFRAAVVLLVDENLSATKWVLDFISAEVASFSYAGTNEDSNSSSFYNATGGRATITMDGLSQFLKDSPPATLPDVPTDLTATGNGLPGIDLSWSAPASDGGSVITAYDLRYVETSADGTLDSNWTAVDDVWTTGSGDLQYTLTGLTADTEYDLQLRAVNAVGDGPWSATVTATPTTASTCDTGSAVPDPTNSPGLVSVCESLLTLLDTLVESNVLNWSADIPISEWDGIRGDSLEGTPPQVVKLYLGGFGLDGKVPGELSGLTELKELYLHDNDLSGPIPPELGGLSNLTHLHLQNNDLTSGIPAELGELTSLKRLFLHSNNLTGVIPVELGKLTRLTHLWLKDNDLTGGIPSELGNMSSLDWLHIAENDISGQIPTELGTLTKLRRLYVYENDLSGPIPGELGGLTRLTHIVAQENDLSGQIPAELGNLANLVWLGLYDNDLEGEIPDELGGLAKLQRLYLHHNELSGEIPEDLGNLSEMTNLWLNHNYLSGQIPESLGDLEKVTRLRLAGNEFTGCLPAGLAAVSNSDADQLGLETCGSSSSGAVSDAHDTHGNGNDPFSSTASETPAGAGDCTTGSAVSDAANNLGLVSDCQTLLAMRDVLVSPLADGEPRLNWSSDTPITDWDGIGDDSLQGSPTRVTRLYLNGLGLDGMIASELSNLSALRVLYLHDNELTGTIPPALGDLPKLTYLYAHNNDLTGSIPAELGELTSLKRLFLHSNNLTGVIPVELGKLTRLTHLWLKDNDLTGGIPSELGNMSSLDWLHIAENDISGQIPAELGTLTKLRRLYVYENDLSGPLPDELGSLTRLTHIVAQENDLSGEIPAELGNLTNSVWLGLYDNDLEGEIPDELGGLAKLQRLYLHHNELSGKIPEELSELSELTNLWLNHNYLSGQIPESLGDLEKVTRLRLAGNEFTGCLPAGLAAVSNSDADQLGLETCSES